MGHAVHQFVTILNHLLLKEHSVLAALRATKFFHIHMKQNQALHSVVDLFMGHYPSHPSLELPE
jgi:hypothetical protein